MSLRDQYAHLLGLPYTSGDQDCYGLARRYYKDVYNLEIVDAARPEKWWEDPDMNLITDFVSTDGWQQVSINPRNLRPGDGLIFSLLHGKANHVGVYVGNGNFIHHVFMRFSCEEALLDKWVSRILMVVRHKEVTESREMFAQKVQMKDILPDHVKRQAKNLS